MDNQTAAVLAAILNSVNWERKGMDPQAIILAGNRGRLGKPLTDWLVAQGWNLGKFVVKERFVIDTSRKANVKISGLGNNFQNWFLGAVEELPLPYELTTFVLPEGMYDEDIIARLGGVAKAIFSLSKIFELMQNQPEGPESNAGKLATNGYSNICYIPQLVKKLDNNHFSYTNLVGEEVQEVLRDSQHLFEVKSQWYVLRAVDVAWGDDGWRVSADSVEGPFMWGVGDQVFSRN